MNASEYLRHWKSKKVWTHLEWPKHQTRFREIATHLAGETAIDVGSVYGHSTYQLSKLTPSIKWSGLDFVKEAIDDAPKFFPQFEFFYAPDHDLGKLFGKRKFDSVVCSEVIEHVPDQISLLKGLHEIALMRIVLTTPNIRVSDPGHLRLHNHLSLVRLLRDAFPDLVVGQNIMILEKTPFFYIVIFVEKDMN